MADAAMNKVTGDIQALTLAMEQYGILNQNVSRSMGIFEKQKRKMSNAIKKSPVYGIAKTLQGYGQAMKNVIKITALNVTMNAEEKEKLRGKMHVMQKLTAGMLTYGGMQKLNNKILTKSNNLLTRFMVSLFSLLSIFLIIGFALAALSIAFEGANSPIFQMTEDLGPLHDAMQGLLIVLTGEGDEGGMAALFDVLAISVLATGIAFLFLTGPVALLVGALTFSVGIARIFSNEFDNVWLSILAGVATFMILVGAFKLVGAVALAMSKGVAVEITSMAGAALLGVGLIIGGVAMLWGFIKGTGNNLYDWLLWLGGVILIFGGLMLLAFTWPIALAIALGIGLVAIVIKYWDEISGFVIGGLTWLGGWIAFIYVAFRAGVLGTLGGIVAIITLVIGIVVGIIVGVFNVLWNLGTSFGKAIMSGGEGLKSWFLNIPKTIKEGFLEGFTEVFNAVTGIYNKFADKLSFKIPKWVKGIGGKGFSLPQIPMLADGGIVNSPTLAMIGEAGPEAVIPLTGKNAGMGLGGGGITVNINVSGVTDRSDKRALAKEIGDLIRAEMSRNGRSFGNRRSGV